MLQLFHPPPYANISLSLPPLYTNISLSLLPPYAKISLPQLIGHDDLSLQVHVCLLYQFTATTTTATVTGATTTDVIQQEAVRCLPLSLEWLARLFHREVTD